MNEENLAQLMFLVRAFSKSKGLDEDEAMGLLLLAGMFQQRAVSQQSGTPMTLDRFQEKIAKMWALLPSN